MTHPEWNETLDWARAQFWTKLEIPAGMVEAIWDRLQYFEYGLVRRSIQEYAFDNVGDRFPGKGLWKHVERRCRDERRGTADDEVENEHGHTAQVRANIARLVKRKSDDPGCTDFSGISDDQAYMLFLVWNRYIPQGEVGEYPGHRYGDVLWLNPVGAGPRTDEQAWCKLTGRSVEAFRMKKLKPEPVRTVLDFVGAGKQ